jgi:hypothetical protein
MVAMSKKLLTAELSDSRSKKPHDSSDDEKSTMSAGIGTMRAPMKTALKGGAEPNKRTTRPKRNLRFNKYDEGK